MNMTVVIPTLNAPTIDRTIESLERQSIDHSLYEVVVVGVDRCGLVRESDLVRFDRSDRPLSQAQARNRGVAQSLGEIIAFIDADCIAHPNWLSVLAARFTDPAASVVGGGVEFDRHNYWTLSDNVSMFHEYRADLPPGRRQQLPALNLAIRREAFLRVGGFDERWKLSEDADLTIRLRRQGYVLHFEPQAVVLHAPPRNNLIDLWRHAFLQGRHSTKNHPLYSSSVGLPWPLRTRLGLLLCAPLLSLAATTRILASRHARSYWHTAPALWLAKMAWCIGAAFHPRDLSQES